MAVLDAAIYLSFEVPAPPAAVVVVFALLVDVLPSSDVSPFLPPSSSPESSGKFSQLCSTMAATRFSYSRLFS